MAVLLHHVSMRTMLFVLFFFMMLLTYWQSHYPPESFGGRTIHVLRPEYSRPKGSSHATAVGALARLPPIQSSDKALGEVVYADPSHRAESKDYDPRVLVNELEHKDVVVDGTRTPRPRIWTKTTTLLVAVATQTDGLKQEGLEQDFLAPGEDESVGTPTPKVEIPNSTSTLAPSPPLLSSILPTPEADAGCPEFPGAENILVMMKTGATELFARIPTNLLTFARCIPNFMIFSDLAQTIGNYTVHDALSNVSQYHKDTHQDFSFYRDLQRVHSARGDVTKLIEGPKTNKDKGWNLDKWKNIPMMHAAYEDVVGRQGKDIRWFVTIDADTYLSIGNLVQVLADVDHRRPHYIGTIYFHGDTAFAQGGTGYIVSRGAVDMLEDIWSDTYVKKWEEETAQICCGDVMMSIALQNAGVNLTSGWPLLQPVAPKDTDWGEWSWCETSLTWHHVRPFEVEALFQFERAWMHRRPESAYLYRDLFDTFVQPQVAERKEDWDNGSHDRTFRPPPDAGAEQHEVPSEGNSWDWKTQAEMEDLWASWSDEQRKAAHSEEDCRAECERDQGCIQWMWKRHGSCSHNWSVKLGSEVKRIVKMENGEEEDTTELQVVSGWMMERIERFKEKMASTGCRPSWNPEGS